ncbi:hypothetical protein VP01_76g18 [Puccinia sorghi]|uniref:Midasin AAA lid domain-containing protein n=1 Tax=Puccinia sorghi TaxID=27349 RepID=A0A0L6UDP5_9BASI|nr:hypothetical protein VP01_76g18 [Puccinia sorghi]
MMAEMGLKAFRTMDTCTWKATNFCEIMRPSSIYNPKPTFFSCSNGSPQCHVNNLCTSSPQSVLLEGGPGVGKTKRGLGLARRNESGSSNCPGRSELLRGPLRHWFLLLRILTIKVDHKKVFQNDLLQICTKMAPAFEWSTISEMVNYQYRLAKQTNPSGSFASLGSPWEFNMRDLGRWLQITSMNGQYDLQPLSPSEYLDLIYTGRFRTLVDQATSKEMTWTPPIVSPLNVPSHILNCAEALIKCLELKWLPIITGTERSGKRLDWYCLSRAMRNRGVEIAFLHDPKLTASSPPIPLSKSSGCSRCSTIFYHQQAQTTYSNCCWMQSDIFTVVSSSWAQCNRANHFLIGGVGPSTILCFVAFDLALKRQMTQHLQDQNRALGHQSLLRLVIAASLLLRLMSHGINSESNDPKNFIDQLDFSVYVNHASNAVLRACLLILKETQERIHVSNHEISEHQVGPLFLSTGEYLILFASSSDSPDNPKWRLLRIIPCTAFLVPSFGPNIDPTLTQPSDFSHHILFKNLIVDGFHSSLAPCPSNSLIANKPFPPSRRLLIDSPWHLHFSRPDFDIRIFFLGFASLIDLASPLSKLPSTCSMHTFSTIVTEWMRDPLIFTIPRRHKPHVAGKFRRPLNAALVEKHPDLAACFTTIINETHPKMLAWYPSVMVLLLDPLFPPKSTPLAKKLVGILEVIMTFLARNESVMSCSINLDCHLYIQASPPPIQLLPCLIKIHPQNFHSLPQANLNFPESDDGSEDDSEEDYPGTAAKRKWPKPDKISKKISSCKNCGCNLTSQIYTNTSYNGILIIPGHVLPMHPLTMIISHPFSITSLPLLFNF